MKYDLRNIDNNLQNAIKEFDNFDVGLDNNGITLFCKLGQRNFLSLENESLIIEYTTISRLIYSLYLYDAIGYLGQTENGYDNLVAMLDMSRNAVRTVSTVKKFIRYLILMGYTGLHLYMEDVYEIPEEPYFGYKRGRYSQKELKEIVAYAKLFEFECIPSIQTLAHLNGITRWRCYGDIIDCNDILLADEEKTYALIENMFKALQSCFSCEQINIGMDEAHMVGLGKYLDQHGYTDRASIIVRHLEKVCNLAKKYGFEKPMMWNDMFIRLANKGDFEHGKVPKEVMSLIPENITLCAWNYVKLDVPFYVDMLNKQKSFGKPVYFAGGANCWHGVTPQNKYALKQTRSAMKGCKKTDVKNFIMTLWGDDGAECSPFATLPVLAYCGGIANKRKDYKKLFEKMTGISFEKFMRLDLPNDVAEMNDPFVHTAKYMLYNDCLQGLFDCTVSDGDSEKYKSIIANLNRLCKNEKWGYLFKTQVELAKLLKIKYDLGVKTRMAYREKDKEKLKTLVKREYTLLLKQIDKFYEAMRKQWYLENKSYGFEVQDYRLGGLKQRVENCKKIINDYIIGKTAVIEELEEDVINVLCDDNANGKSIWFCQVSKMITANII